MIELAAAAAVVFDLSRFRYSLEKLQ